MRKNKKAIAMNVMIMMIIGLVVLGMMVYIANKYILGAGKTAGEISGCEGQGGTCETKEVCQGKTGYQAFYKVGCPPEGEANKAKVYCCIKSII